MKKLFGLMMCAMVAFALGCGDTKKTKTTDKTTQETTTEKKTTDNK